MLQRLALEFEPNRLLPNLMAGAIIGITVIIIQVSFAAMIFTGPLSGYLVIGIGLSLFSGALIAIIYALTSSYVGTVGCSQDNPAVIISLIAIAISNNFSGSTEQLFATIIMTLALTGVLSGITFVIMGTFNLGNFARFLPYPVIGGFLAGTGWLLFQGGFSILSDYTLTITALPHLFQSDIWIKWLPGLLFAFIMLVSLRRFKHFLIMPGLIVGAIALFYLTLLLTNIPIAEASQQDWLLGPFPESSLWQLLTLEAISQADWGAIFRQGGNIVTIIVLSAVAMLLNTSGIEIATQKDIDLNHELKITGFANMLVGLVGGLTGYTSLSLSTLGSRTKAEGRLVGLVGAALTGLTLIFGAALLSYIPAFIVGGILMFLGLSFLVEWLYDAWGKLPRADYFIVLLILGVIAFVGFLEGVGVGIAASIILFVLNYSRIDVVKHSLTGGDFQSNVERPRLYQQLIKEKGYWLCILKLHGFIFFGTSNSLMERVRKLIIEPESQPPRYIILDFKLTTGLDSSAMLSFTKMRQLAESHDIMLILTGLTPAIQRQMEEVFPEPECRIFPNLDRGVEWCEDQMIETFESVGFTAQPKTLLQLLEESLPPSVSIDALMQYFNKQNIEAGHVLLQQGVIPEGLFFIEQGQVTALREQPDCETLRLRTLVGGSVVGELSTYLQNPAVASVVADKPCVVYGLSNAAITEMETKDEPVAMAFHRFVAHLLAEKLDATTRTMETLLR